MRRVRCPVMVLTGDQEDTWRELDRPTSSPTGRRGSARVTRWCRAPVTTSTSRTPTRRCAHIEAFVPRCATRVGVTAAFLLHDLGSEAAGEPWRAVVPEGWEAPDLPGHGATPRRATVPTTRWARSRSPAGRSRQGLAVGVGQNAHGALILAAGAVATPWRSSTACGVRGRAPRSRSTRCTPASDGCSPTRARRRRRPAAGLDPRASHGYGVTMSASFAQRFWGAITCPVLADRDARVATPPDERADGSAGSAGRRRARELHGGGGPGRVVAAIAGGDGAGAARFEPEIGFC